MKQNLVYSISRLVLFAQFFVADVAFAQKADTMVIFYKASLDEIYPVYKREDADFIRTIPPIDPIDKTIHIVDYFPNGKIRMEGKANPEYTDATTGMFSFIGDCVNYFPNGKKQSTASYARGQKEGMETMYFPDGNIYYTIEHISQGYGFVTKPLYRDCYDLSGNMICKNGNGQWITYYDDYKQIQVQGQVKNGLKDGEWKGSAGLTPLIKYVSKYKKGKFLSGIGYDSTGKAYSFINELDPPSYNEKNPVNFMEVFHQHFTIPRDVNGKKINMDTIYFSFVIEKDGTLSNVEVLKNDNSQLKYNVNDALMKCGKWHPAFCYGVPLRTKLTFGYKINQDRYQTSPNGSSVYWKEIEYNAEIIGI